MLSRSLRLAAAAAAIGTFVSAASATAAPDSLSTYRRHGASHAQPGSTSTAGHLFSGYQVNRQGFGNFTRGPDGSFGGYPAGSAGAQELEMNQHYKCRDVPEMC